MTKILKKSLACLLVFALCFTAIASCLAVNAAAPAMSAGFVMYAQRPSSNDTAVGRVCVGETLRAQISLVDITAGDTIGITLDMPKGVNPDEISVAGWNWNTPAAYETVAQHYDPETSKFSMIINVTSSGNYLMFIRYKVTEEMQKNQVFVLECVVEGANSSAAGDDNIFTHTETRPIEIFEHDVVVDDAVAATCEGTGLTEGSHCARCEVVLEAQEEVKALGHDYEGVANPDSTCNSEGTMVYTCKNDASHTYTEAISKKDHTPAADLVNNGDNHSVVCDVCKVVLETADHDFTNGDCACGAAKPSQGVTEDPNLKFQGVSMAFGTSSLEMNFRVRQTVLNLYDRVELVIIPQKYNTSTKNYAVPEEIVVQESQMGGTSIRTYQYTDMMLYELALDVQYKLRAYDGDVLVAESALASKSAVSYLKNDVLNGTGAGITEDLKRVAVDMLIVCEEARKAMATAGSQLEADSKVSVLDGVDLTLATPEVNKNHNKVNNFDPSADGWGILDTDKYYVKTSVAMEKVPVLGLRITDNREFDLNKFNIKVSYTSASSAGYQEENLTGAKLTRSGKFITTKFTNVGLHDSNADITLEFSYDGVVKGTLTYSMETFLGSSLEDPTIGKLAGALLNLGASFRKLKGY